MQAVVCILFFFPGVYFCFMVRCLRQYFWIVMLVAAGKAGGQPGQLSIPRIDQMPDLPAPYLLRDWKAVAQGYDAFVFDQTRTGTYLPLVGMAESGINYPLLKPVLLQTYVGSLSANQAEAINILPAVVGASLAGIDKASQDGVNWVAKTKDFFNAANGQNVYLNGYNTLSGNDWWYDVMPNVFFFQLSTLYNDSDYDGQITAVADQWLAAVRAMGGNTMPWTVPDMNYRAWRLSTMTGNTTGVPEPEASGAIGWLLYAAYAKTGQQKYLDGSRQTLEFLSSLNTNPSYELQLPYGTVTAARLNATADANYDVGKMLNWSFDRGPLRGWGTIVGKWDGKDISGLIGEANDSGNDYAFMMNGYQQAAALAPVIKYDKRYAKELSKWILNVANASRYYYPQFLDAARQDDYTWSNTYDPASVIGYEALKENWNGNALYGTGDAKRSGWAQTNLALYGSSHVGYLGALVNETDVEGILRIDLNKTDFFGQNAYVSYAYFNPHDQDQQVTIALDGEHDIYDAISETIIANDASGDHKISVRAGEVLVVTLLPANADPQSSGGKLLNDGNVVDYHYGYDFTPVLTIKSLATASSMYEFGEMLTLYAAVDNASGPLSYKWYVNDELIETTTTGSFEWMAPDVEGENVIRLEVSDGASTTSRELTISVRKEVPRAPVVIAIEQGAPFYYHGAQARLICRVDQAATGKINYVWNAGGEPFTQTDSLILWQPGNEGLYAISCTATNAHGLSTTFTTTVLVKDDQEPAIDVLAWYPLNGDVKDYSGHGYNAILEDAQKAPDAQGNAGLAYRITSTDEVIYVPNAVSLNFTDEITLSCWISVTPTGREAFILSHGSWEKRWKISLTPDNHIRWTVKTSEGTVDLDSKDPVDANRYYHVAVTYTGYSLELYVDGILNGFMPHQGSMLQADDPITFGQKDDEETQYYLNGVIDEVRIFNQALQPWQIATLKTLWQEVVTAAVESRPDVMIPYPNPTTEGIVFLDNQADPVGGVSIIMSDGRSARIPFEQNGEQVRINIGTAIKGLILIRLERASSRHTYKLLVR